MAAPEVYHLTNVHSPFDARIFYKQAQTLARAGYAVTVVGPGPEEWNVESEQGCACKPYRWHEGSASGF